MSGKCVVQLAEVCMCFRGGGLRVCGVEGCGVGGCVCVNVVSEGGGEYGCECVVVCICVL